MPSTMNLISGGCDIRSRPLETLPMTSAPFVAAQRDYLAGIDVEVDIGQRLHGTEVLRDPSQFENWLLLVARGDGLAVASRFLWLLIQFPSPLLADVRLRHALADLRETAVLGLDPPVLDEQLCVSCGHWYDLQHH